MDNEKDLMQGNENNEETEATQMANSQEQEIEIDAEESGNDLSIEESNPINQEKKNLNMTLVIVGGIVLVAVIVMLYITVIAPLMNSTKKTETPVPYAYSYLSIINKDNTINIDKRLYTAIFLDNQTRKQSDQTLGLTNAAAINAYWAIPANLSNLKKVALTYVKDQLLTVNKAVVDGYILTQAEIDSVKSNTTSQLMQQFQTQEKIDEYFQKSYQISFNDYMQISEYMSLVQKYQTEGYKKYLSKITDAEKKAYYKKNTATYGKYQVQHILINTSDATGAKLKAAKAKAESILAMAKKKGADFTALAKKYSQDTGALTTGQVGQGLNGIYDVTSASQFVKEFKDWALDTKHKVGAIAIVKTQFGFHIMKQLVAGVQSYDKVKTQVGDDIAKAKFQDALKAYIADNSKLPIANQAELDSVVTQPAVDPTPAPVVPTTLP